MPECVSPVCAERRGARALYLSVTSDVSHGLELMTLRLAGVHCGLLLITQATAHDIPRRLGAVCVHSVVIWWAG